MGYISNWQGLHILFQLRGTEANHKNKSIVFLIESSINVLG